MTLKRPIKDGLERKLDDARLAAVWRRVRNERQATRPRAWRLGFVALPLAVVAVALVVWLRVPRETAPLLLADATPVTALATTEQPRTIDLADGSQITLSPGALLQPIANRDRVFGTKLVRGRAEFEVRPGGPRRWLVEAGEVTVEVVGTHFIVDRAPRSVKVLVTRGEVLVRGKGVVGGTQSLRVGQSLQVDDSADATRGNGMATSGSAPGEVVVASQPPAAYQIMAERIAGADPHLPDAVKLKLRGQPEHSFSARICVGTDGIVSDVSVLQGIAGADDSLQETLRQWRYAPQPIPVCFVTQLVFSIE
jgi:hypothetical protein